MTDNQHSNQTLSSIVSDSGSNSSNDPQGSNKNSQRSSTSSGSSNSTQKKLKGSGRYRHDPYAGSASAKVAVLEDGTELQQRSGSSGSLSPGVLGNFAAPYSLMGGGSGGPPSASSKPSSRRHTVGSSAPLQDLEDGSTSFTRSSPPYSEGEDDHHQRHTTRRMTSHSNSSNNGAGGVVGGSTYYSHHQHNQVQAPQPVGGFAPPQGHMQQQQPRVPHVGTNNNSPTYHQQWFPSSSNNGNVNSFGLPQPQLQQHLLHQGSRIHQSHTHHQSSNAAFYNNNSPTMNNTEVFPSAATNLQNHNFYPHHHPNAASAPLSVGMPLQNQQQHYPSMGPIFGSTINHTNSISYNNQRLHTQHQSEPAPRVLLHAKALEGRVTFVPFFSARSSTPSGISSPTSLSPPAALSAGDEFVNSTRTTNSSTTGSGGSSFSPGMPPASHTTARVRPTRTSNMFLGQLSVAITESQLTWLVQTFGNGTDLFDLDRITRLEKNSRDKKVPTGAFHCSVATEHVEPLRALLNRSILIEETGVWVAGPAADALLHPSSSALAAAKKKHLEQQEILVAYCATMKANKTLRPINGNPYGTMQCEVSNSKFVL